MLRDITLGQYIPGDTVIHRLDPRCKIILTILYIAIIFCVTSPVWYVIPLAYLLVASRLSGLSAKRLLKSVKPLRFLLILTFFSPPVPRYGCSGGSCVSRRKGS